MLYQVGGGKGTEQKTHHITQPKKAKKGALSQINRSKFYAKRVRQQLRRLHCPCARWRGTWAKQVHGPSLEDAVLESSSPVCVKERRQQLWRQHSRKHHSLLKLTLKTSWFLRHSVCPARFKQNLTCLYLGNARGCICVTVGHQRHDDSDMFI